MWFNVDLNYFSTMKPKTITTVLAMGDRSKTEVRCDNASVEGRAADSVVNESHRPKVLLS